MVEYRLQGLACVPYNLEESIPDEEKNQVGLAGTEGCLPICL